MTNLRIRPAVALHCRATRPEARLPALSDLLERDAGAAQPRGHAASPASRDDQPRPDGCAPARGPHALRHVGADQVMMSWFLCDPRRGAVQPSANPAASRLPLALAESPPDRRSFRGQRPRTVELLPDGTADLDAMRWRQPRHRRRHRLLPTARPALPSLRGDRGFVADTPDDVMIMSSGPTSTATKPACTAVPLIEEY